MQRRANQKYLLFALLPLFIIAAALWGDVPKNADAFASKAPLSLSKAITSSQHEVPFVSNDIPQISRAEYRSPHKNPVITAYSLSSPFMLSVYSKEFDVFAAGNYSCLFKNLFPEHEFS